MSGGVGVRLVTLIGVEVESRLEKPGSECYCLLVRTSGVLNVQVEVDLLRAALRPIRRDVVRGKLDADPPLARGVNDAVPTVIPRRRAPENSGPEPALRMQICGVEHDDLAYHSQARIIGTAGSRAALS
jgi:hypothetical protein